MKFLSDLLVQGDGNEIFLKSADHNISRIIPRGTGANLDKGLFSLFDTGTEDVRIDTAGVSWFNGGNVGIGTTSPEGKLNIEAAAESAIPALGANTTFLKISNSGGAYGTMIGQLSTGDGYIQSQRFDGGNSVYNLLLQKNGGKVGIGTTSPNEKLTVAGNIHAYAPSGINAGLFASTAAGATSIAIRSSGVTFFNAGNVGIGTTSPNARLNVKSTDSTTDQITLTHSGNTVNVVAIGQESSHGSLVLRANSGVNKVRLSAAGNSSYILDSNVGIGTTSPYGRLNVIPSSNPTTSTAANQISVGESSGNAQYNLRLGYFLEGGAYKGSIQSISGNTPNTLVLNGDGGGVGIGTTNPGTKLHVKESTANILIGADDTYGANYSAIGFGGLSNGHNRIFAGYNGSSVYDDMYYAAGTGKGHQFRTNGSGGTKVIITSGGNVGIGTTSPAEKLDVSGNIQVGDGGTGASIKYNSTNRGTILVNGSEIMRLEAAGNVGIGTTSPSHKLDVYSAAGVDQVARFQSPDDGAFIQIRDNDTLGQVTVKDGVMAMGLNSNYPANTMLNILNSGNVGIGTTAPATKLHLADTSDVYLTLESTNTSLSEEAAIKYSNFNTGANYWWQGLNQSENWSLGYGTSFSSSTTKLFVSTSGNVGIGTASPNARLSVLSTSTGYSSDSQIKISDGSTSYYGGLSFDDAGSTRLSVRNSYDGTGAIVGFGFGGSSDKVQIINGTGLIVNEGNVGIGTTSPDRKLHVNSGSDNANAIFESTDTAVTIRLKDLTGSAEIESRNDFRFSNNAGVDQRMVISSTGAIKFNNYGAGTLVTDANGNITASSGGGEGGPYLPLAGGTITGVTQFNDHTQHGDQVQAKWGASNDLTIEHNATDSSITNITGDLYITNKADDKDIVFRTDDGSGGYATYFYLDGSGSLTRVTKNFRTDDNIKFQLGSAGDASLYHNGTNTVFANETGHLIFENRSDDKDIYFKSDNGSGGVIDYFVINGGTLENVFYKNVALRDNVKATFGNSNDLQIYHDGSYSFISNTGTGSLIVRATNFAVQSADGTDDFITTVQNAQVNLFYNNAKKFETTSTGVAVTGKISGLTAGTANTDAVNVQQLNNATTGTLIYKGTWSAAPTTTSVLDGAVSSTGTIVIDAANPGISVGATITGTGISGTVTVSNIAADGITIAISSSQTIADGTTLTFTTVGGTPDLSQSSRKVTGHYYICETAGAATPNGASTTPNEWAVGDWATFSDLTTDAWQKIDNSSVLSGAGTGGKVPVWSGSGTSVTLADAPITVSGNNATFAGNITFGDSHTIGDDGDDNLVIASSASENIIIDSADDIVLDAAGNDVLFKDAGTHIGTINMSSSNLTIESSVSDKDIIFKGRDGTSTITALTLDMSNGGSATFIDDIDFGGKITQTGTGTNTFAGNITGTSAQFIDTTNPDGGGGAGEGGSLTVEGRRDGTANLISLRARDASAPTVALPDGQGGLIRWQGFDGTDFAQMGAISVVADGQAVANSDAPSKMIFYTTPDGSDALTTALTLDKSQNATFAGNVTLSSTAPILYLANTTSSTGKTWRFSSAANGNAYITQDGVIDAITLSHTSGNATFAGAVDVNGNLTVEDEIHLTDGGSTVRGKLLLNSSDRDNVELRAESLGSTMKFFTVGTEALELDASQNATFAGDITIGSSGASSDKTLNILTGGSKSSVKLMEAGTVYGFSTVYDGATNKFHINRHNNSAAGTSVLSLNRDNDSATFAGTGTFGGQLTVNPNATSSIRIGTAGTNAGLVFAAVGDELYLGANNTHQIRLKTNNDVEFVANATFAGDVTATANYTAGNSKIIYKAQRSGGAVAGDWSYDDATTDMSLGTSTAHSFSLKTGNTRALTINSSQNATFAGNVTIGDNSASEIFLAFNSSSTDFALGANGSNFMIGTSSDLDSGNLITLSGTNGRLGIGTTSPSSKLQVAGGIQMAGDTAAASADKVGTMRYRTDTEYVEVNGTELVTNGDFATDSDWTKEAGWSIASGKASYDASSATNALYQSIGLTTGSVYRLSFTVVNYTSGSFKGHLSNGNVTAATDAISANGDYSFNITATGALVLFRNVTSFNGSIDNVSVIEVTAEDASYADMCMQTGASTYEWVNIVRNTY